MKTIQKKPIKKTRKAVQKAVERPRESGRRLRLVQTYLFFAVSIFSILAFLASRIAYFPFDLRVTRAVQFFQPTWFDQLMRFVSQIGFYPQMTLTMVGAGSVLLFLGLWWEALVGVVAWTTAGSVVVLIKELVGRPRPSFDLVEVMARLKEYSFPSGHVVIYTVFFGYLWFLSFVLLKKSPLRTALLILCGFFVVAVGPSRIYLGAHWASDVAGAYVLGSVILLLSVLFYRWGKNRFFKKQEVATKIDEVNK